MADTSTAPVRNWHIYKITNPIGRIYIGKTCNLKKRKSHYSQADCASQSVIYNSLKKYGFKAHKFEVIDQFESDISYANGKEIFWIRTYMSHENKWRMNIGMNMCEGGRGTIGVKRTEAQKKAISLKNTGFRHTPEALKKISEASKGNKHRAGKKQSESEILKRSLSLKGHKTGFAAKPLSRESIEKRRLKMIGRKKPAHLVEKQIIMATRLFGKRISQYSINGEFIKNFDSIASASRELNIDKSSISDVLHNKYKQMKGFIFKFKDNAANS